jgi:hypothetical protein
MASLEIHLSDEEYQKLEAYAQRELREPVSQAKVFVLEALGLWPVKAPAKGAAKLKTVSAKRAVLPVSADGLQSGVTSHHD